SFTSLGVETINVDGEVIRVGDRMWRAWEVEPFEEGASRGQRVAFTLDILREGDPVVRVVRTYALPQQPRSMHRHDLRSEVTIENLDGNKHQVIVAFRGGMGVPKEGTRIDDRYVDCGIHDGVRVVGNRQRPSSVARKKGEPVRLFAPDPGEPDKALSWAALGNRYFTCTIAPVDAKAARSKAYAEVAAVDLDARAETSDDVTVRFTTLPVTVQPGAKTSFPLDLYLGEKDGRAFKTLEPYRSRNYYFQVAQGYGWCTFTWLVELMIGLLNGMYAVASKVGLGDYGLAIIVLVLIVRLLLHPITKKGQVNMVRMQEGMADLAPKMEELKRKFGNDKVRLQQETMKLYREKGINPATQVLSCLPMFIQMPIWVALYLSLTNNILMRHQPLHFTWVRDLTAPDALYTFSSPITIPLLGWTIPSFNLLPLLVAVFMYTQQKLQPKPEPNPNMSEQQKQQQEMMQKMGPLMSIMMLLIFYKMPSGLNLYIMASSLFGTIEQHRIRRHIKEAKEKGTLLQPAAKPAETVRPRRRRREEMGFFEKLQKMAEEAQKAQPKRPAKDKRRKR
ncbi:MAG: membrane protein insertase YidC, partial [Planctomycetota bacterium]